MASQDEYQQQQFFKEKDKFIQINGKYIGHKANLISSDIKCEDEGNILWFAQISQLQSARKIIPITIDKT